jgi:hypothetical protein
VDTVTTPATSRAGGTTRTLLVDLRSHSYAVLPLPMASVYLAQDSTDLAGPVFPVTDRDARIPDLTHLPRLPHC